MSRVRSFLVAIALAGGLAGCEALQRSELPAELAGPWVVQQIAGAALGEGVDIYFAIDAEAGAMIGFTGCNRFSAPMSSFAGALAVGAIQEEPGQCNSAEAGTDEARFLGVLPAIQRYARRGASLEFLSADHGEALLKLRVDNLATLTDAAARH